MEGIEMQFFSIAFIRVDEHSANLILNIHQGHLK